MVKKSKMVFHQFLHACTHNWLIINFTTYKWEERHNRVCANGKWYQTLVTLVCRWCYPFGFWCLICVVTVSSSVWCSRGDLILFFNVQSIKKVYWKLVNVNLDCIVKITIVQSTLLLRFFLAMNDTFLYHAQC